jgi:subtilisin family serine protease
MWSAPASYTVTIAGVPVTCAAGTHGFNAIARTCDPRDDNNHGSHVSGTIGSLGNNQLGVTGVNWNASIMGVKFLDASGSGSTSDAINAIEFAIQARNAFAASGAANVRVLSNSWGGGGFSQGLLDEINKANAAGMLFVAAAGNSASSNDVTTFYPAGFTAPNIIAVAATNNADQLASFSNYGTSVHLAAPGVDILSTTIGNGYQFFSGTSMATPHVSGAAALVLSKCNLGVADLKATILNNVDVLPSLSGRVGTSGRLDVDKALRSCAPAQAPSIPTGFVVK